MQSFDLSFFGNSMLVMKVVLQSSGRSVTDN